MSGKPVGFTNTRQALIRYSGLAVLILLFIAPAAVSSYGLSLLTQVLIYALLAMSLNVLVGYTGLFSFNHATFFGVSGYAAGLLLIRGISNFWVLLLAGIVAAMLGFLILRSSGPYFFMLTLAFGQLVFAVAWKWRSFTGGDDGLPGISRPQLGFDIFLWDNTLFFYVVLAFFLLAFLVLWKLVGSSFGRSITGVRESESRMQALGYNTWLIKYISYISAAGLAAVAGVLHAFYNGFVSPQELNWTMSGLIMLMVIIGGAGILAGPAVGAGIIVVLQNWTSSFTDRWPLIIGTIFIICVMFARNGIAGKVHELLLKGDWRNEGAGSKKHQ